MRIKRLSTFKIGRPGFSVVEILIGLALLAIGGFYLASLVGPRSQSDRQSFKNDCFSLAQLKLNRIQVNGFDSAKNTLGSLGCPATETETAANLSSTESEAQKLLSRLKSPERKTTYDIIHFNTLAQTCVPVSNLGPNTQYVIRAKVQVTYQDTDPSGTLIQKSCSQQTLLKSTAETDPTCLIKQMPGTYDSPGAAVSGLKDPFVCYATNHQFEVALSNNRPNWTLECQYDLGGWAPCSGTLNYPGPLSDGEHEFQCRSKSSLGDTSQASIYRYWVSSTAPSISIVPLVGRNMRDLSKDRLDTKASPSARFSASPNSNETLCAASPGGTLSGEWDFTIQSSPDLRVNPVWMVVKLNGTPECDDRGPGGIQTCGNPSGFGDSTPLTSKNLDNFVVSSSSGSGIVKTLTEGCNQTLEFQVIDRCGRYGDSASPDYDPEIGGSGSCTDCNTRQASVIQNLHAFQSTPTLTMDDSATTYGVLSPAPKIQCNGTSAFNYSVSLPGSLSCLQWLIDDTLLNNYTANPLGSYSNLKFASGSGAKASTPRSFSSLSDGSHSYGERLIDWCGNQVLSPSNSGAPASNFPDPSPEWSTDQTPPTASITCDPSGGTSCGASGSGTDANLQGCSCQELSPTPGGNCNAPSHTSPGQTYTFQVTCLDLCGKSDSKNCNCQVASTTTTSTSTSTTTSITTTSTSTTTSVATTTSVPTTTSTASTTTSVACGSQNSSCFSDSDCCSGLNCGNGVKCCPTSQNGLCDGGPNMNRCCGGPADCPGSNCSF